MAQIGNVRCGCCGGQEQIQEAKGGTLSIRCAGCGKQGFIRSPNGIELVRKSIGAPAPAKDDLYAQL